MVLSLDLSYVSILVVVRGCLDNIFARLWYISGHFRRDIHLREIDIFDAKLDPQCIDQLFFRYIVMFDQSRSQSFFFLCLIF